MPGGMETYDNHIHTLTAYRILIKFHFCYLINFQVPSELIITLDLGHT